MASLIAAHRGYEYQDLLAAVRLVDVPLGLVAESWVDEKLVEDDRFDDLTIVYVSGARERAQFKHTDNNDRPLTLRTFTADDRSLRIDRLVASALNDRVGPGSTASSCVFRIVLRDLYPEDHHLVDVLRPARPDPGPYVPKMATTRLSFDADKLWTQSTDDGPFAVLSTALPDLKRADLAWACERIVVEVGAPAASADLTEPGPAELILLDRIRREIGAEAFPNQHRSTVDVSAAFITTARAARQGRLRVTAEELLRRAQLRTDFGAVTKAHPVDRETLVERAAIVDELFAKGSQLAEAGGRLLVTGPPGQGKSWVCQQLVERMSNSGWIVAEHYCFLGDADGERTERVLTEHLFGSLVARLAEADPTLVEHHRPRFAADEEALEVCLQQSQQNAERAPVVLIVDGLDHITRVRRMSRHTSDPSLTLAEALQAINLPPGCVLIVLSQPGKHLTPLTEGGSVAYEVPGLDGSELRDLAESHGVIRGTRSNPGADSPLLVEKELVEDFLSAVADRSNGNALYATYLCREVLRDRLIADAASAVRRIPAFDGTLEAYYRYLLDGEGEDVGWVAEIAAVTNFGIQRSEFREIFPEFAHRVDSALGHLSPVLDERASQGVRIYHESLARFIRQRFDRETSAHTSLLLTVAQWLENQGLFVDSRTYKNLLPILTEAGEGGRVVDLVGLDFVERSIAAGFPASAVIANLGCAVGAAATTQGWPQVVRYVELSRAAEAFQDERYDSVLVEFADVYLALLGTDVISDRMLDDGRCAVPTRAGIQMCAAIDRLGGVAPWPEYMVGYRRESEHDNTSYGMDSDRWVTAAWVRGRLRLTGKGYASAANGSAKELSRDSDGLLAPINWGALADWLDDNPTAVADLVGAVLDTHGLDGIAELMSESQRLGDLCLAVAEAANSSDTALSEVDPRSWATAALTHGIAPGTAHRMLVLGVGAEDLAVASIDEARSRLGDLTRRVQEPSIQFESDDLLPWLDLLAIASVRDPSSLAFSSALVVGDGWYRCWLRFAIHLVRAEAAPPNSQPSDALTALDVLTEDLRPFVGDPRACDLYRVQAFIGETVRRAFSLLDAEHWEEGLKTLKTVSEHISTTLFGEIGGPIPTDLVLDIAVRTAPRDNHAYADELVSEEIENGAAGRYYSDLASYHLHRARLAIASNDRDVACDSWQRACGLLGGYGWRKDITIYELLDPLPSLISADPEKARRAVAAVQGLCERVPLHTDGKETRWAPQTWWGLLAKADPVALVNMAAAELLDSCNEPDQLLFDALDDFWRATSRTSDPVASAALRVSINSPLEVDDADLLARLISVQNGDSDVIRRLATLMVARHDERPTKYPSSDGDDILRRDDERSDAVSTVATESGLSRSIPLRDPGPVERDAHRPNRPTRSQPNVALAPGEFGVGTVGLGRAIRAWRNRPYETADPGWSEERFAAAIGYRLIELTNAGRESEARAALDMLADTIGFTDRSELLGSLAQGLDRHGHKELGAHAYTLAWTRAGGHGGWFSFGGETGVEFLNRASLLSRDVCRAVLGEEIARFVVSARMGTYGISRALIYAFAAGYAESLDLAFGMWWEAFGVISARAPVVHALDKPTLQYMPSAGDQGTSVLGNVDGALGIALAAGMAHASRERKRRTLASFSALIALRPEIAAEGLNFALGANCDPATHEWLLGLLRRHADSPLLVQACVGSLAQLAQSPYLAVRFMARRLLDGERELPPPGTPSAALMHDDDIDWRSGSEIEQHASVNVLHHAGVRIAEGTVDLPGLGPVVRSLVIADMRGERYEQRQREQIRAFADSFGKRWSDAYLAKEQLVEEHLQRSAGTGRAARLVAGEPVLDPEQWEDALGNALFDDPRIAIILESTRVPRPDIPPVPSPRHRWWSKLPSPDGVRSRQDGDRYVATIAVGEPDGFPRAEGWPIHGWKWLATVEERTFGHLDVRRSEEWFTASRYRVAEIRVREDEQALTTPPVTSGGLRLWRAQVDHDLFDGFERSQPLLGIDRDFAILGDNSATLGCPRMLLTPTASLLAALELEPTDEIGYADEAGPALLPAIWRADYDRSDYHLPIAQTVGTGIAIRSDLLDQLGALSGGNLVLRDFVAADVNLRSPEAGTDS